LRTSSRLRITRLTSARSVARTRHAAMIDISGASAGYHDAVRGDGQRHLVRRTELGCVLHCWGRWSDEALQAKSAIASLTGCASSSGWSRAGCQVQRPTMFIRGGS
jgi:hypothetical protein